MISFHGLVLLVLVKGSGGSLFYFLPFLPDIQCRTSAQQCQLSLSEKEKQMKKVNTVLNFYLKQNENSSKKQAARNIKTLLEELDKNAEVVPENNYRMLSELITDLKGSELNYYENELIILITNS